MVLEVAVLDIAGKNEEAFEASMRRAEPLIEDAWVSFHRCSTMY